MRAPTDKLTYAVAAVIGMAPFMINGYLNATLARWPPAYWAFEIAAWVALPALLFSYLYRHAGLSFTELGFHGRIFGKRNLPLLLFICLLFCPLEHLLYTRTYAYLQTVLPDSGSFHYEAMVPAGGIGQFIVALYFALTAGIVEEIYYRGLLFRLARFLKNTVPLYLLISPLIFAASHWESGMANSAAAYIFGIFTASAFLLMRNIWPLIIGHIYTDYLWFG